ncbi:hypothetical protein [Desulfovibrio piger]|uniref:hypothetical protein n=1 Tax=Desulfovibrio piger TaxID=901 RepID=UPI0039F46006
MAERKDFQLEKAELRLSKRAYRAAVDDAHKAIMAVRDARERVRRAESRMKEMGLNG